jgi:hypothetical protein
MDRRVITPHNKHWLLTDWEQSFHTSHQTMITGLWECLLTNIRFFHTSDHRSKRNHRSKVVLADWQQSFYTSKKSQVCGSTDWLIAVFSHLIKILITGQCEYSLTDCRVFKPHKKTLITGLYLYSLTESTVFTPSKKHRSQVCGLLNEWQ